MLLLPMTVGPFTLVRKLGTGGVSESYLGRLDADGGRPVVVRRVLPYISRDAGRLASVEARVRDLVGLKHPFLVEVLDWVEDGDERFIIEAWVEGVDLQRVLNSARAGARVLPPNVFLNIATQVCNGLEALHGRAGRGTGSSSVLHLGMKPDSIILTREGRALIGGYGLSRSPTALPHGAMSAPVPTRMEYLSPEQTQTTQQLSPASDIFTLGAILYELLTLEPLFRSESNLHTIHRIRKADVAEALQRVRAIMPGLDKVLYRALSINSRHRYQRAFVLREDLRGLMASYSFSSIVEDTRRYLAPLLGPEDALSGESDDPELSLELSLDAPLALAVGAPPAALDAGLDESTAAGLPPPLDRAPPLAAASPETTEPDLAESERTDTLTAGLTAASVVAIAHPTLVPDDASASLSDAFEEAAAADPLPEDPGFWAPPPVLPEPAPAPALPPALEEIRPDSNTAEPTENHEPDLDLDALPPGLGVAGLAALGASAAVVAALAASDSGGRHDGEAPALDEEEDDDAAPLDTSVFVAGGPLKPARLLAPPPEEPPMDEDPWLAEVGWLPPPPPAPPEPALPEAALEPAPPAALPPPPAPPPLAPPLPDEAPSAELATEQIDPQRLGHLAGIGLDDADPNSTRGFLLGHVPAPLAPPPAVPDVPAPLPGFTLPPEAVPPVAAPPPVAAAPVEAPRPLAPTPAPAEDADPPPAGAATSGTSTLLIGIGLAAVALLVCGGGALWRLGSADPAVEVAAAPAPTPTPVPAPAPPAASPEAAQAAQVDAAPAEALPAATDDRAARDQAAADALAVAEPRRAPPVAPSAAARSAARPRLPAPEPVPDEVQVAMLRPRATAPAPEPDLPPAPAADSGIDGGAYATLSRAAERGQLARADRLRLEGVDRGAADYSRSRALLVMDAQRRDDAKAEGRYLQELMTVPENRYNPVFLSDLARWQVNEGRYDAARSSAREAEQQWARIPSAIMFAKKAEIYRAQAAAAQGLFNESGGDVARLDDAIDAWRRYEAHVAARSREDLASSARDAVASLEDIRERLK